MVTSNSHAATSTIKSTTYSSCYQLHFPRRNLRSASAIAIPLPSPAVQSNSSLLTIMNFRSISSRPNHIEDKGGFRAQVKTNEAGTANQNPAHVEVKADPPHHHLHHEPHHHVPHVHHHHIPLHHHIPHHHEVKIEHHVPVHHHIPHHHEVKIEHHVPVHHHIPHHHEIKIDHHVPLHHDFKNLHHHDFKGYHHLSSPLSSYKFDTFAPLHGFSYNPSAFHHGYGHWPFQESNNYGHLKHHEGFQYNGPHHNYHHGIGHGFNFGSDINGLSSFNKDKYEKIIEEIKKYRHQEPLNDFGGLKSHLFSEFDNGTDNKVCDGVDFVSRKEWRARRSVDTSPLALPVNHVIILHTVFGACDNTPLCIRNVQFIQDYHMDEKGWWDIAYSFLIGGDGRVYIGVGFRNVGEFTINYNTIGIGIAFMGNFDIMTPSDQMINAAKNLIKCGIKKGYLTPSIEIHGQRDATCTASPGKNLYAKIKQWDNFVGGRLSLYHCCADHMKTTKST
ncbi:peptidoglycan-recognition protein 1 [Trichonephila clavata]|uniref:Peptidoglycan-recognition protein 1 n=1 Tax=Trichonephila clavata TaxID=2740835 RepID=A0A8X6F0B8_TRICU|nr:peptidoglycan-recognition protein 1 [Trichonephila clavata]